MSTRLPYGLSYIKPGARSGEYTFTAGDTTPDVSMGTVFFTATSGITITNFDGGEIGKIIYIRSGSGSVTTIQNSAGGINIFNMVVAVSGAGLITFSASGGNAVLLNREVIGFLHNGTDWNQIGTRAVFSTQI